MRLQGRVEKNTNMNHFLHGLIIWCYIRAIDVILRPKGYLEMNKDVESVNSATLQFLHLYCRVKIGSHMFLFAIDR